MIPGLSALTSLTGGGGLTGGGFSGGDLETKTSYGGSNGSEMIMGSKSTIPPAAFYALGGVAVVGLFAWIIKGK